MKKIEVDRETCIKCGFCFSSFPEYFQSDSEGISKPVKERVEDNNDIIVASESCPTGAIKVEDVDNREN